LIALAHFLNWAAGSLWSALILFAPDLSRATWVDSVNLPAYPLALAGVLSFPGIYRRGSSPLRTVTDTLLIIVGTGIGAWYFIYRPAISASATGTNALYLAFNYPALDVSLAVMTGASCLRAANPATRAALAWLFGGAVLSAIANGIYSVLSLTNAYYP